MNDVLEDNNFYLSFSNEFELYAGFKREDQDFLNKIYSKTQFSFNKLQSEYKNVKSIDSLLNSKVLEAKEFVPVYIMYNKPKGIICTTEKIKNNIVDAIKHTETIYPVGRLDKDSEGLILLTNHGEVIDKIANPAMEHEKEYIVTLNMPVREKFLKLSRFLIRMVNFNKYIHQ